MKTIFKKVTFILIQFIWVNLSFAQSIDPISIVNTLTGKVLVKPAPVHYLTKIPFSKNTIDTTKWVTVKEYKIILKGDTIKSGMNVINYIQYPQSANLFTFKGASQVAHFPKTIEDKLKQLNSHIVELQDYYWDGTGSINSQRAYPHILKLKYNSKGLLKKIDETYVKADDTKKNNSTVWKYKYKGNHLMLVSAGVNVGFNYDKNNKLISVISYQGKLSKDIVQLRMDSIIDYHQRKLTTYQIRDIINNSSCEIYDLVHYKYDGDNLTKMVCYQSGYGIQISNLLYDSLNRLVEIIEDYTFDGLKIMYEYDQENKLLKRTERRLSDCFTRGCPETEVVELYCYNEAGMVVKIEHLSFSCDADGTKRISSDTGLLKVYEYSQK